MPYAIKRNGKPTGKWKVDVWANGERFQDRFDDFDKAVAAEASFKANGVLKSNPEVAKVLAGDRPSTLLAAIDAADGKCWKGQDTEADSMRKLRLFGQLVGDMALDSIDLHVVDTFITALGKQGIKGPTVNRYLSNVSKFLKWTCARQYRKAPPFKMEMERESKGRIRYLRREEEPVIRDLAKAWFWKVISVDVATGMRAMELLNLRAGQVTWDPAKEFGWVRLYDGETKNDEGRIIPIARATYDDLAWLVGLDGNARNMPSYRMLRREWDKLRRDMSKREDMAALGLDYGREFVFHCLRHTCATRLAEANVNAFAIMQWMGHKNIETTLKYVKLTSQSLETALGQLVNASKPRLAIAA